MWNNAISETGVLNSVVETLHKLLPASWQIGLVRELSPRGGPDAFIEIRSPDGSRVLVAVEVKKRIDPRDVPLVLNQLRHYAEGKPLLVAASYLGARTRELLTEAGVSYADATGNLRLTIERPAMIIQLVGANTNPWPEERPLQSLKGPAAGRVVRALCDFRPPFGIRELATRSATSPASVSRVVALLDREALLVRDPRGTVIDVDWPKLIRRWTRDYSFTNANHVQTFLEPRGLRSLQQKLTTVSWRYAVTGSLAAVDVAPVAAPRLAAVYVEDISRASADLNIRQTDAGANVLLAEPFDPVVFERTRSVNGLTNAAPTQVAADLLTSPGRGPAEGEELIRWMEQHEDVWRT